MTDQNPSVDIDKLIEETDCDITAYEAKIQDLDIDLRRQAVLEAVAEQVDVTGTVTLYDLSRANEVAPDTLQAAGNNSEVVSAALNALSGKLSNAGPFRAIISILLMLAGLGMILYSFIQEQKAHRAYMDNLQTWRKKMTDNGPMFTIKTVSYSSSDMRAALAKVGDDPTCAALFKRIEAKWESITGKPLGKSITEFLDKPIGPWQLPDGNVIKVQTSVYWDKSSREEIRKFSKYLATTVGDLYHGLDKLSQHIDRIASNVAKGDLRPVNEVDVTAIVRVKNPDGKESIMYSATPKLVEYVQELFPDLYPEKELSASAIATRQARLLLNKGRFRAESIEETVEAVRVGETAGDAIADPIKSIADIEKSLAEKLKTIQSNAAAHLEKLQGAEKGDFNVMMRKLSAELGYIKEFNAVLNKSVIASVKYARASARLVIASGEFKELSDELNEKAKKFAYAAIKEKGGDPDKLAGLNDFQPTDGYIDRYKQAAIAGTVEHTDVEIMVNREVERIDRLTDIRNRIESTGEICRADIKEIESVSPGLLSDLPDRPMFTFSPSQNGLEPALNALSDKVDKGWVKLILAILAGAIGIATAVAMFRNKHGSALDSKVKAIDDFATKLMETEAEVKDTIQTKPFNGISNDERYTAIKNLETMWNHMHRSFEDNDANHFKFEKWAKTPMLPYQAASDQMTEYVSLFYLHGGAHALWVRAEATIRMYIVKYNEAIEASRKTLVEMEKAFNAGQRPPFDSLSKYLTNEENLYRGTPEGKAIRDVLNQLYPYLKYGKEEIPTELADRRAAEFRKPGFVPLALPDVNAIIGQSTKVVGDVSAAADKGKNELERFSDEVATRLKTLDDELKALRSKDPALYEEWTKFIHAYRKTLSRVTAMTSELNIFCIDVNYGIGKTETFLNQLNHFVKNMLKLKQEVMGDKK